MATFHLKIVTPESLVYEGEAERIILRTVQGEVAILPRHIDYLTALGTGPCRVTYDGHVHHATCSGGMLHVAKGSVEVLSTQFEWTNED
ncbi:MAG: ATP synthase F1 subunit epsilon [Clostridia bacterium]|nr:ATP synthase F1 subunit epsilon [Clostridia bacterium]